MKLKLYLSSVLSICVLAVMAQKTSTKHFTESTKIKSELSADDSGIKSVKKVTAKGGSAPDVIWSEDFSDGLNGQGDNGAWTTEGAEGGLWFQAFPPLEPNGYDPDGLVPEYGDIYPNYNDGLADDEIPFTTASNGFMMFDADRANSNQTDPDSEVPDATFNALDAILVSPAIDLTGVDFAVLTFWERMRMCCAGVQSISVDFSTDGGTSWVPYDLFILSENFVQPSANNSGPFLETSPAINISEQLQQSSDLSDCRIRVVWDASLDASGSSHYYTMFDDFQIIGLPDNDLTAGRTFFNNHFEAEFLFVTEDTPPVDLDYLRKLEFFNQPNYITRPFNFAATVTNSGGVEQTGVRLLVNAFLDDVQLNDQPFESDPITIGPGVGDTLRIYDVTPDWWVDPQPGVYSFEYEIVQDAEDFRPEDNIGLPRATRISTDAGNDGFAIMQNDRNLYTNFYPAATAPQLSEDVIFGNRQVFTESGVAEGDNAVITHVEFALAGTEQASTVPGEIIYINVRTGSAVSPLTEENPDFRYFEEDEVEYVIEESDLTTGGTPNWISVELPQPVLIAPDVIYQAEIEVPSIGIPSVFICLSNEQEFGSGVAYNVTDPADTPQGWQYTGEAIPMIRFRTSYILSTDAVSYESGIKLTQNYPNPVVDNTMIQYQLDEASAVTFEVFDITGKLVHSEDLGNVPAMTNQIIEFNSVGLASGTYTYGVVTENERLTRKMIIQ